MVTSDETQRRQRGQAIALFRYQLICPALETGLGIMVRGRLVRQIASRTDAAKLELAVLKWENPTRTYTYTYTYTCTQIKQILRAATGWASSESTLL